MASNPSNANRSSASKSTNKNYSAVAAAPKLANVMRINQAQGMARPAVNKENKSNTDVFSPGVIGLGNPKKSFNSQGVKGIPSQ